MSQIVEIQSTSQFSTLLANSTIVVADFYADWCGPCKQIAPIYSELAEHLSKPNKITFTKINTDNQQELARSYGVTAMPTFMIFKNARVTDTIQGANPPRLSAAVRKLAEEAGNLESDGGEGSSGSSGSNWMGASLPRGYSDVTSQVDVTNLELLNWDTSGGSARTIFQQTQAKGELSFRGKWLGANVWQMTRKTASRATPTNSS
jgi:thioredoxin